MKPTALQLGPASDADFTTEILIQLKSGEAFTLFLTDSGYAQIEGKFKALPILDTKKIPLYMHILCHTTNLNDSKLCSLNTLSACRIIGCISSHGLGKAFHIASCSGSFSSV
jgi:hypothetical protein